MTPNDARICRLRRPLDDKHRFLKVRWDGERQDQSIDWVLVSDMLHGEKPRAQDLLDRVNYRMSPRVTDYDMVEDGTLCLLSQRARSVLEPLVEGQTEFIPVRVNGMVYFSLLPRLLDALDRERSTIHMIGSVSDVKKYVFNKSKIEAPAIFRIPESKAHVFVTGDVAQAMTTAGLKGLVFVDYENPPPDELIC